MDKSTNIFLIGPMGVGKSTIGKFLSKELNLHFYDTDQVIETRAGANLAWIFDVEGEKGFQKREENVVEELTQKKGIVLATGGGVVLSEQNRKILVSRGIVVYLRASIELQLERTKKDTRRPLLRTKKGLLKRLEELYDVLEPHYQELADLTINTEGLSVREVAIRIANQIKSERFERGQR